MTTKDLKQAIKDLSQKQRETKLQRKTNLPVGTSRTIHPHDAQMLALSQKETLKHMYIAYALLRGKPISKAISPIKGTDGTDPTHFDYSKRMVEEIMEKYGEAVRVSAN